MPPFASRNVGKLAFPTISRPVSPMGVMTSLPLTRAGTSAIRRRESSADPGSSRAAPTRARHPQVVEEDVDGFRAAHAQRRRGYDPPAPWSRCRKMSRDRPSASPPSRGAPFDGAGVSPECRGHRKSRPRLSRGSIATFAVNARSGPGADLRRVHDHAATIDSRSRGYCRAHRHRIRGFFSGSLRRRLGARSQPDRRSKARQSPFTRIVVILRSIPAMEPAILIPRARAISFVCAR